MAKLQFYKQFTPLSHFIEIYLQIKEVILEKGELPRAVQVLLKVIGMLSRCEMEQYGVYLELMKVYVRMGEV